MKRCYKCKQVKELSEFHKLSRSKDGHQGRCKACACEAAREHGRKNRTVKIARATAWNKANPERRREILFKNNAKRREFPDSETYCPEYEIFKEAIAAAKSHQECVDICEDFLDSAASRYIGIPEDVESILADTLH